MFSSLKLLSSGFCRRGLIQEVGHRLATNSAVSDSPMARLRRKTGYAFSLCRKALEMHSQDIEKAEQWLRAEAAKQGWERAQRVKQRVTADGLIGVFRAQDKGLAAMLEINCETDFVARNQLFAELASVLTKSLAERLPQDSEGGQHSDSGSVISKWLITGDQLSTLSPELVLDAIGKLGENIRLSKACLVSTGSEPNLQLIGYTHAVGGRVAATDDSVLLGKYGTIIALKAGPIINELGEDITKTDEEVEEIGKQLSQHIIGMNPLTIEPKAGAEALGDDGPTALLDQQFIFDEDLTVSQYLNDSNIKVLDFIRFECGIN